MDIDSCIWVRLAIVSLILSILSFHLREAVAIQVQEYSKAINQIFCKAQKPISFAISDMIWARCQFIDTYNLNKCCFEIMKHLKDEKNKGLKLIEINNRLRTKHSDLVIRIAIGSTFGEMRLILSRSYLQHEFLLHLEKLVNNKYLSPLSQLYVFNQDLSKKYFQQVQSIISRNLFNEDQQFPQAIQFLKMFKNIKSFLKQCQLDFDIKEKPASIDKIMLQGQIAKFYKLRQSKQVKDFQPKDLCYLIYREAEYLIQIGDHTRAQRSLSYALSRLAGQVNSQEKYSQLLRHHYQSYVYHLLGQVYRATDKDELAQDVYLKSIHMIKEKQCLCKKCQYVKIKSQQSLASICLKQQRYQEAFEFYNQLLESGQDQKQQIQTLKKMATVEKNLNNYQSALEYFKEIKQIQQQILDKNDPAILNTVFQIGQQYYNMCDYEQSIKYFQQMLKKSEQLGLPTTYIAQNIVVIQIICKNYEKTEEYLKQCLQSFLQSSQQALARSQYKLYSYLYNYGFYQCKLGDNPQGIRIFLQSLRITQSEQDYRQTKSQIVRVLGQPAYPRPIQLFLAYLETQEKTSTHPKIDVISGLKSIAETYAREGDYITASEYFCMSIKHHQKFSLSKPSPVLLKNLAECYKHFDEKKLLELIKTYQLEPA